MCGSEPAGYSFRPSGSYIYYGKFVDDKKFADMECARSGGSAEWDCASCFQTRAGEDCAATLWDALCSDYAYGTTSSDYRLGFYCGRRTAPAFARAQIDALAASATRGCTGASCYENYACWGYAEPLPYENTGAEASSWGAEVTIDGVACAVFDDEGGTLAHNPPHLSMSMENVCKFVGNLAKSPGAADFQTKDSNRQGSRTGCMLYPTDYAAQASCADKSNHITRNGVTFCMVQGAGSFVDIPNWAALSCEAPAARWSGCSGGTFWANDDVSCHGEPGGEWKVTTHKLNTEDGSGTIGNSSFALDDNNEMTILTMHGLGGAFTRSITTDLPGWTSMGGADTCASYESKGWCEDGGAGPTWLADCWVGKNTPL